MKTFDELPAREQAGRLRRLAQNALEQYDLSITRLRLVGKFTNTLFRAWPADGPSYMVRVCKPGWRTNADLRSEGMWLQALSSSDEIGAPVPVLARDGQFFVEASAEGVPESRRCVVMTWLPGISLEKRLTEANLYKMGLLFSRLHEFSLHFIPLPGFTTRKMDSIYARGEEDVLFGESCREAFTQRSRDIFERTRRVLEETCVRLYAGPGLRVIHNDLWHGNIKIHHGQLHPLDFEDTVWGYPVQDIAMALQDLMSAASPAIFERHRASFRAGYESRCPWPESEPGQIDTFRAGRMIWVANFVARYERQYLANHIAWNARVFEHFLDTGEISLAYANPAPA